MTRRWAAVAAVTIAAALAYAPSFSVPFQYDDYARIGGNRALRDGHLLDALIWFGNSRVVPSLTLVWNYQLSGADPRSYHAVNFLVHLLTTAGVMALALALCRTPRVGWSETRAWWVATAAGVVFACHPLQTQAVTYIIQRYASMAALFYVWAAVCFLRGRLLQHGIGRGRPARAFTATAVLGVCAVLSKENAVSLPAALLLLEWIGFGWPRRRRLLAAVAAAMLLIVAIPVAWKALVATPKQLFGQELPLRTRLYYAFITPPATKRRGVPTVWEYAVTQTTVIPRYGLLVLRPWGLNVDHDVPIVAAVTPATAAGAALIVAVAALGIALVRRHPLAALALLWPLITLSVESSIVPIVDPMVEHRMYLPLAGVAIGVGALFALARGHWPRVARTAGAAVAGALIALTFARNVVWQTPLTLWLDAAEKSPDKARVHLNAGVAYHHLEQLDDAVGHYCRALELDPDDQLTQDNLEVAMEDLGGGLKGTLAHVGRGRNIYIEVEELEEEPAEFCARRRREASGGAATPERPE